MKTRKGFILTMWTGPVVNERTGRPILFSTYASATRYLARLPSWGHHAVNVRLCTVKQGANGLPDYIVGANAL